MARSLADTGTQSRFIIICRFEFRNLLPNGGNLTFYAPYSMGATCINTDHVLPIMYSRDTNKSDIQLEIDHQRIRALPVGKPGPRMQETSRRCASIPEMKTWQQGKLQ
jgi:hypothetical protein